MGINSTFDNSATTKLWNAIVTILATLCVALLLQYVVFGRSVPSRDEVNKSIDTVKSDVTTHEKEREDEIDARLDGLEKAMEAASVKLEHVTTLLEKQGGSR